MAAAPIPTGTPMANLASPNVTAEGEEGDFNLLVAGLPRDVDEHVLRAMFEPYGDVKRALVMYKANTAQSRGFGFVLFGNSVAGQKAIDTMDGTEFQGSVLSVRRSKHDGRVEESDKIFARNIPKDVPVDFIVQTFETVLGTKVAITKMTPGSTTAVITVTLRLDSVAIARDAIDKLHLKHFTTFYEALGDVPPLPPVPEGRPAVPEMLVKFAESDQSRNDRQSKNRAERPPPLPQQQQAQQAQLHNGPPMPPPPLPAGHAGAGARRETRTTERRSRTQSHHSEWTQQQHQQPMPPSPGHFGYPGHPHYQHHHQHHPHQHHHQHDQPRQHHQPHHHHSPHDGRGAPPSYLSGPPPQVHPIPGGGVPPVAMMQWPQGYAMPTPGGGMQNYAAVPGGQQGTPGVFFVPIGPPSAGQPHVSPGPPPGFLPLPSQHPGMPPPGAAGYGVPMPPAHGAATTGSPGAPQAWPGETTPQ